MEWLRTTAWARSGGSWVPERIAWWRLWYCGDPFVRAEACSYSRQSANKNRSVNQRRRERKWPTLNRNFCIVVWLPDTRYSPCSRICSGFDSNCTMHSTKTFGKFVNSCRLIFSKSLSKHGSSGRKCYTITSWAKWSHGQNTYFERCASVWASLSRDDFWISIAAHRQSTRICFSKTKRLSIHWASDSKSDEPWVWAAIPIHVSPLEPPQAYASDPRSAVWASSPHLVHVATPRAALYSLAAVPPTASWNRRQCASYVVADVSMLSNCWLSSLQLVNCNHGIPKWINSKHIQFLARSTEASSGTRNRNSLHSYLKLDWVVIKNLLRLRVRLKSPSASVVGFWAIVSPPNRTKKQCHSYRIRLQLLACFCVWTFLV